MTRPEKTASVLMGIVILISFAFGCYKAVEPHDTDAILIECGINPVNGAYLGK